jgi:hypothetical protein
LGDLSPGERTSSEDHLALELYGQAQRLGWEVVLALQPLRLSAWQAEMLLLRLEYLAQVLPGRQAQFHE